MTQFWSKNGTNRVAQNFCGSLFLRNGDFCVLGELVLEIMTDWLFLMGINFCDFQKVARIDDINFSFFIEYVQWKYIFSKQYYGVYPM